MHSAYPQTIFYPVVSFLHFPPQAFFKVDNNITMVHIVRIISRSRSKVDKRFVKQDKVALVAPRWCDQYAPWAPSILQSDVCKLFWFGNNSGSIAPIQSILNISDQKHVVFG